MKNLFFTSIIMLSVAFTASAQTMSADSVSTTTVPTAGIADPGLIPGDLFYFMDRWAEVLSTTFTFNKEKKARKSLEYAKERVAEIKEVLETPDAELSDILGAKEDFDSQVADAVSLLEDEKNKGNDVSKLAKELDDELDESVSALKDVLNEHKDKSSRSEDEIRSKLAGLPINAPERSGLMQALESITKEKNDTDKEKQDIDKELEDEQKLFEDIMGKEMSALKHIEQAMRLRDDFDGLSENMSDQASELLMKQAQDAMLRGDFDNAKRISKEVQDLLENESDDRNDDEMNINDVDTDSLEEEIRKSERMMDNLVR